MTARRSKPTAMIFQSPDVSAAATAGELLAAAGVAVTLAGSDTTWEVYLDTVDWWLWRAGVSLRLRTGPEGQTLALAPLDASRGLLAESADLIETLSGEAPSFPGPVPGKRIAARLAACVPEGPVDVRVRIDAERTTHIVGAADAVQFRIEAAALGVVSGARAEACSQITVVREKGPAKAFKTLCRQLASLPGMQPVTACAVARALALVDVTPARPADESAFTLQREMRLVDAAYCVLGRHFARMVDNQPGTQLGLDAEYLHDMRVATRRLRAALSVFGGGLPPRRVRMLHRDLRWVGRALGTVRDLDVHLDYLTATASGLPTELGEALELYREHLLARRRRSRAVLLRLLRTRRYDVFVGRFRRFLELGPPKRSRASRAREPVTAAAREVIEKRLDKVLGAGRALTVDAPDVALHALRIRCKKLRYACEFFADVYGAKAAKLARRATTLQDALGEHQDAVVARQTLSTFAGKLSAPARRSRRLLLAMGHLMAQYDRRARKTRAAFARLWKRFDRKKVRKPLKTRLRKWS